MDLFRTLTVAAAFALLSSCGGGGGGGSSSDQPDPPPQIPPGDLMLTGTVSVSPAVAADADTNDPGAPRSSATCEFFDLVGGINDCPSTAQLLPSPGTAGGYLNFPGVGRTGPTYNNGDRYDFYRANLAAGQVIRLEISDFDPSAPFGTSNDIDLILLDIEGGIIEDFDASEFVAGSSYGPTETLTIKESGEYVVLVSICFGRAAVDGQILNICGRGASNYVLTIGQAASEGAAQSFQLTDDFIPGEALVFYPDAADRGTDDLSAVASSLQSPAPESRMQLQKFAAASTAIKAESDIADDVQFRVADHLVAKAQTLIQMRDLVVAGEVERVEPNFARYAQAFPLDPPNDPGYSIQWHYDLINLPGAWQEPFGPGGGNNNVTVAVIDSGVLLNHEDLDGQFIGGYDFVSDFDNDRDGEPGIDDDATDPGDSSTFGFSSSYHGTHVAGTVVAIADNAKGVVGVAPGARVLPIRALGRFGGSSLDIMRSICYAAGLTLEPYCDGVPLNTRPADIINLSLGGSGSSLSEQEVVRQAIDAGVTIVAAAGNNSSSNKFYPAAYDGVIAVSAVTIERKPASYSNFGSYIDVAAPGGNLSADINGDGWPDGVLSTGGNDAFSRPADYVYPFFQGTSMAAPHVAGVVALMKSANPSLSPLVIDELLETGQLTDPTTQPDQFGAGIINAQKALVAALAAPGGGEVPVPKPWLGITPRALNFGATLRDLSFSLRNNAGGDLSIVSIESDQAWLIAPEPDGLGEYTLRVNRNVLPSPGSESNTYAGKLTITSNVNVIELNVIMQKSRSLLSGDAGHLYVRLVDPQTGEIREVSANVEGGEYTWQMNDIPPGNYQLFAFTDADNDKRVCDSGEACGAYLTTDQPVVVEVLEGLDVHGLDFQVGYGAAFSGEDGGSK